MRVLTRGIVLIILLAVVEVILTEAAIRSGLAGVERATSILFILIVFNAALLAMSARRGRT